MKKLFEVVAALITIAAPTAMQAQEGFYVGGFAGANFLDMRSQHVSMEENNTIRSKVCADTGYALGLNLGFKTCYGVRFEGEVAYRRNELDKLKLNYGRIDQTHTSLLSHTKAKGHLRTWSYMANAYYDFDNTFGVSPYLGAGIGYDDVNGTMCIESETFKHKGKGLAWQGMAGLNYDLSDTVVLNLEYKLHMSKANIKTNDRDHTLAVGVKHFF